MLKLNLTLPVKTEAELVVAQLVSVGVDKQALKHRIACKTSSGKEANLTRTSHQKNSFHINVLGVRHDHKVTP